MKQANMIFKKYHQSKASNSKFVIDENCTINDENLEKILNAIMASKTIRADESVSAFSDSEFDPEEEDIGNNNLDQSLSFALPH